MFVILDTNHYREWVHKTSLGARLQRRLEDADADVFITVITAQEVTQGWAAEINRKRSGRDQVPAYHQFMAALKAFEKITILPFDEEAAGEFHRQQKSVKKAGPMDLKIAGIAISHDARLLSRNLAHFTHIPGLRVENWLD